MKIGILICGFNCDEYIHDVLKPFIALKNECNMQLAVTHGIFKEYFEKKITVPEDGDSTLEILNTYKDITP